MENVIGISINTGESQQTIKGLKDEIKRLQDEILNVEKNTEQYNKAVAKLQDNQRRYNEVMALTKKEATALEGSYDALVHQMSLLKKEWRATNDEVKRNELGKQIDDINTQLKEFDASTGNFQRNVGNYTGGIIDAFAQLKEEVKDARNALLQAEEGTDAYADAMKRLSDAQFQLRDINEQSRYAVADFGEQLSNVVGITQGVVAGFSAFQSVMVLAGAETEDFEKIMIKVQASMALVQGLQGLEGLIDRVKGFTSVIKVASKSIGKGGWIGLLITATATIGTLIYKLREKNKAIKDGSVYIDEYNKKIKESVTDVGKEVAELQVLNSIATDTTLSIDKRTIATEKLLKKLGLQITEENKLKGLQGDLKKEIDNVTISLIKQAQARAILNMLEEKYNELAKNEIEQRIIGERVTSKWAQGERGDKKDINRLKELQTEATNLRDSIKVISKQINSSYKSLFTELGLDDTTTTLPFLKPFDVSTIKKNLEEYKKAIENETTTQDTSSTLPLKPFDVDAIRVNLAEYNQTIKDEEINALKQNIEETNNAYDLAIREKQINGENPFDLQIEKIKSQIANIDELILNTDDADEREKLMWEKANLELDIIEQTNEEKKRLREEDEQNEKEHQANLYSISMASMSSLSNLFSSMADIYESDEKNAEKYAEEIKAFRITSAVIDTIQGAVSAFAGAMQLGPIAGPIVGALNAAAVTAMGIANINKIKNTKVGDKSANIDNNINSSQVTPNTDYTQSNPFSYSRNVTGVREYEELNKEQRVILVESDLTNALRKVEVRDRETSF